MNLYVGTSGFSYKEWKGSFYPKDLPAARMLSFYGEHFRAVEINNTFYRMPNASTLEAWTSEVPSEFKFILKAPQLITHRKRLKECAEPVSSFLEIAGTLGKKLGPLLFQMPPNMKKDAARLRDFLAMLPSKHRATFEFRHASWFDQEVFDLLASHKAALCIADESDDLVVPFEATVDWGYLRLRRAEYSDKEMKAWVKKVQQQDWRDAFVFFRHEDEGKGPRFASKFLELAS